MLDLVAALVVVSERLREVLAQLLGDECGERDALQLLFKDAAIADDLVLFIEESHILLAVLLAEFGADALMTSFAVELLGAVGPNALLALGHLQLGLLLEDAERRVCGVRYGRESSLWLDIGLRNGLCLVG